MRIERKPLIALGLLVLAISLGIAQLQLQRAATAQGTAGMAPAFEVDPFWPKPLPNHWILGNTIGVAVDSRDRVYIVHRTEDEIFGELREREFPVKISYRFFL